MDPGGGREREVRLPSLLAALTPPALLLVLLAAAFALYGDEAMGGPVQVALMMCA
jgi:Na+:H+ antiporter, NhaC family